MIHAMSALLLLALLLYVPITAACIVLACRLYRRRRAIWRAARIDQGDLK